MSPMTDVRLREHYERLRKELQKSRLENLKLKGDLANYRRLMGESSDDEWWAGIR